MKNLIKSTAVFMCLMASMASANRNDTTTAAAPTTPSSTGVPAAGATGTGKAVDGATMTDVTTTSDAARGELMAVSEVKSVGTLNSNIKRYEGKTVRVRGEIESKIDARTAIIESGGLFNNEIAIVVSPTALGPQVSNLREDDEVYVTGKIYTKSLSDFRLEHSWTLAPEIEQELNKKRAILIVDEIVPVAR